MQISPPDFRNGMGGTFPPSYLRRAEGDLKPFTHKIADREKNPRAKKEKMKKLSNFMKNHRKRILIIGGTIIALALIIWFFYDYYQVLNKIDKDYYQIEYGQKIPDSLYDYVILIKFIQKSTIKIFMFR